MPRLSLPLFTPARKRAFTRGLANRAFFSLLALGVFCVSWAHATEQPQLDTDDMLKPLVDTRQSNPAPLQGSVGKQGQASSPARQSLIITGKVQTLQQAIESEKDTVDWYVWYLGARSYLGRAGGLQCALGTPIKFYRNGQIEAMSFDPVCQASVAGRFFPLPPKTKLDALILPVRNGQAPPASPQELYSRINAGQRR
jgi:hypothetical protein